MKRRLFGILLVTALLSIALCSCRNVKTESDTADKDMMSVVATGFVQYDFARYRNGNLSPNTTVFLAAPSTMFLKSSFRLSSSALNSARFFS